MDTLKTGKCGCGQIEFGFTGEPLHTYFCCCLECQKISGSDKILLNSIPAKNFKLLKGKPASYSRLGKSGKAVTNYFCSNCGLIVYAKPDAVDFFGVPVVRLENANDYKPQMAIHTAVVPSWSMLPEGLPCFEGTPHQ